MDTKFDESLSSLTSAHANKAEPSKIVPTGTSQKKTFLDPALKGGMDDSLASISLHNPSLRLEDNLTATKETKLEPLRTGELEPPILQVHMETEWCRACEYRAIVEDDKREEAAKTKGTASMSLNRQELFRSLCDSDALVSFDI